MEPEPKSEPLSAEETIAMNRIIESLKNDENFATLPDPDFDICAKYFLKKWSDGKITLSESFPYPLESVDEQVEEEEYQSMKKNRVSAA